MASKGTYDHQQIQRYLQKEMSSAEMHAFEKDMMNDPLLADALEGYRDSNDILANRHLAEIAERIKEGKEGKEGTAVIYKIRGNWLRIAALLIIISGAGLITYNIINKAGDQKGIAAIDKVTVLPVDSLRAPDLPSEQQELLTQKLPANTTSASSPLIKQQPPAEITGVETMPAAAPLALKSIELTVDSTSKTNVDVHAPPEGLTKEKSATAAKAPEKLSEPAVTANRSFAQPKDGWVKLQAYIDNEVDKAKEKNNALTGMNVELEFSIDKNGNVVDIKILSASNNEVAKISINILRKSPRWTQLANTPRAKTVIRF